MTLYKTIFCLLVIFLISIHGYTESIIEGELKKWEPLTFHFQGPTTTETSSDPNPFLDYRLQVLFTAPSGAEYNVPGFFDGNGEGGETGDIWSAWFAADEIGEWKYTVSFRRGSGVAVSLSPQDGAPVSFDGAIGRFTIEEQSKIAPGFLKWGRLEYAGAFYLKFRDGGYWIRGGTDSPENFLAYAGFDNTPASHTYEHHLKDWNEGDPDWGNGQGKAIIGALNYLAKKRVNSVYFLTMNIGGDGKDVFPWVGNPDPNGNPKNNNLHFDISKLRQWNTVFTHAQRKGIFLHFVLNEAEKENKQELDNGELGTERKLYYRELIARFGHHLALQWNLCEEYNLGFNLKPERIQTFADYIQAIDPYHHPITVHPQGNPLDALQFIFGDPRFSITSIQLNQRRIDALTEQFRKAAADAGRPIPISMDEFTVDKGFNKSYDPVDDADAYRKEKLWPVYLSGGMIEFILEGLLKLENFGTPEREALWDDMYYARSFMENHLPFWEMEPADELVQNEGTIPVGLGEGKTFPLGAQVFIKKREIYAIYLPTADPVGTIDLSMSNGKFTLKWYNPRTGKFEGENRSIDGGAVVPLGNAPSDPKEDWAILIHKK